ncbi:uncharacterized protein STEHIDRAFT_165886 [Stereum hirsutum FP-91666 SS1]|uniref:uncharacterized protein n=1 Tax=Stereum hirsutum (strain FP-91666) TaxID=721885 RepID=UPI000440D877|nr:uncharacterized protein STEHIDRAFT_165886 [Stereum hirsutum FP-91666 SS1]EIM91666.1 hypothetical protein STEHIDRAFT_165886 [Stereum hirsutum FP-91666 SS1]
MVGFKSLSQAAAVITFAKLARAHGAVSLLNIGGTDYSGYLPYNDPYANPAVERIVRPYYSNGPVADFTTSNITCNGDDSAAALTATANAGDPVTFYWDTWPDSHKGPTMTYMAKCDTDDCSTFTGLDGNVWFKIDEAGLNSDGTWASDDLIANNNSWTVTIPSDIASGGYLLRHELLALHSASSALGAQFYPSCAQLTVSGSGSATPSGVALPGAYATDDPGILINIYYPTPTTYAIPGPTVYSAGGSTGSATSAAASSITSSAASTSAAAASSSAAAVTSSSSSSSAAAVSTSAAAAASSSVATSASACPATSTATAATSSAAAVTSSSAAAAATSSAVMSATSSAAGSTVTAITDANVCMNNYNSCIAASQPDPDWTGCSATKDTCLEGATYNRLKRSMKFKREHANTKRNWSSRAWM